MKKIILLAMCIFLFGCTKISSFDSSLGNYDLNGNEGVKQVYVTVIGKVTSIDSQMDGLILNIDTGNGNVEVLARIPNLGKEFASALTDIEIDTFVRIEGEELDGRVIAREMYRVLPYGYTMESYTVEEVTNVSCNSDSECETPMDYLVQSRCPFTSLCLDSKCTVICPDYVRSPISADYCQSEGGRVAVECSADEIDIGNIKDKICCMPSGGKAEAG